MSKFRTVFFTIGAICFLPLALHAGQVDLKLVNVSPGYNDGQYYVYPYNFSINGSTTLSSLICDDFWDEIWIGESWKANVFDITNVALAGNGQMTPQASNSLAYSNGQDRTRAYREAAWLYQKLIYGPLNQTNSVNINHTIWALFSNTPYYNDSNVLGLFNQAKAATEGMTDAQAASQFGNVVFYTPIEGTQFPTQYQAYRPQELIGTRVPEPGSVVLLFSGLLGIIVGRKKMSQQ